MHPSSCLVLPATSQLDHPHRMNSPSLSYIITAHRQRPCLHTTKQDLSSSSTSTPGTTLSSCLHLFAMGLVFSSSPVRSTGADVKDNVIWALDESAFWESECALVKAILSQAIAASDQELAEQIGLCVPSAQAADVDRTTNARPLTVKELNNCCYSALNGMDLAAGDDSNHRTKPYLLADPAHAHLARRAFAAAATQNLQSSVTTIESSDLASSVHHVKYSQAEERDVEVVVVEGPLDTRNTSTASPPAVNVVDVTSTNPSARPGPFPSSR